MLKPTLLKSKSPIIKGILKAEYPYIFRQSVYNPADIIHRAYICGGADDAPSSHRYDYVIELHEHVEVVVSSKTFYKVYILLGLTDII